MTEHAVYENALDTITAAYREALRAFADHFEREWQHKDREEWEKSYAEPYPGDEWRDGYNAGVRSVGIALDSFLDECSY